MTGHRPGRRWPMAAIIGCAMAWGISPSAVMAATVELDDGRIIEGQIAPLASLKQETSRGAPKDGAPVAKRIVMIDDGLRRYFVSDRHVRNVGGSGGEVFESFTLWQPAKDAGMQVQTVGSILRITPFDEFGRRTFTMNTTRGPLDIIQGITEITPQWVKIEGLSHVWEQRLATSAIPREELDAMLAKVIEPTNVEHRLKVVRLYLQSERYADAQRELESVLADFPDVKARVAPALDRLRQLGAQQLLNELRLRRSAGQHQLFGELLAQFPSEGIAGETLQEVRELLNEYEVGGKRRETIISQLQGDLAQMAGDDLRDRAGAAVDEIAGELSLDTLDRLTPYEQLSVEKELTPQQRLALATSGWLAGAGAATENLPVALAMLDVRNKIREYLTEPIQLERTRILAEIHSSEAGIPRTVDRLVRHMKPPWPMEDSLPDRPGMFQFTVHGIAEEPEFAYLIQLPPEYDPYRRYPTVVTLHGSASSLETQIDWWAGSMATEGPAAGHRMGQATRRGYIVIAPAWAKLKQSRYEYSAREHMAVLNCLRDACRRFAIDTDRVFLSGHSMGGDAAWDIGQAHPDLWAGVIPITAEADRYTALYWENARNLPFYFVTGELDGDKTVNNAGDLDRMLFEGYNVTIAEFRGRGHEHFSDEIQQLFDWMGRYRRDFFPREFECRVMRPWDNFFWWLEIQGVPDRNVVLPDRWPPPRNKRPTIVTGKVTATNNLRVRARVDKIIVWLAPELVDFNFDQMIDINVNGSRLRGARTTLEGDLEVLLEDVRTRGDRQHPFWAKVEFGSG